MMGQEEACSLTWKQVKEQTSENQPKSDSDSRFRIKEFIIPF